MASRTRYGFFTGLLNALAVDWSGRGPTYRDWHVIESRDLRRHGIGQSVGFAIMASLMCGAFVAGLFDYFYTGVGLALLALGCIVASNSIAAILR